MYNFNKRLNLILVAGLFVMGSVKAATITEIASIVPQYQAQPKPASPGKSAVGKSNPGNKATPAASKVKPTATQPAKVTAYRNQQFGISPDRKSTLNKEFKIHSNGNGLPVVISRYKVVDDRIYGYLYESLVAEEFDEVNGDEDVPENGQVTENKEEEKAEIDMDMDSLIENAADMNIYGEIDYYDGQVIGISIMMESLSHKTIDRNHYLFNALTGEVVDVWAVKSLAGKKMEWMQRVKTAYAEAVDVALNTPCLLVDQNAADLLLARKNLRDSDFQMDEFTRSQPLYLRDGKLIFDYTVLQRCDPGGVQLSIQ